ncbi:MAG: ThuA domain-containing protein [Blastocatellia bacterium]|nr:ThuA domain-containing protein [Blastocatellia bacterium]
MDDQKIQVTVWNEFQHEKRDLAVKSIYPDGIHETIASHLRKLDKVEVKTATLDQPEQGLSQQILDSTDVLIWWGHIAHNQVSNEAVLRVCQRVWEGMGLIVLHSGHFSKVFKALMGTSCNLKWREAQDSEILWVTSPGHPITAGINDHIRLEIEEMYGEHFDIPEPDETIFISSFTGGEVFRSGCVWKRGAGKVFYFRPGHETHPTYHHPLILRVIENAALWLAPTKQTYQQKYGKHFPINPVPKP